MNKIYFLHIESSEEHLVYPFRKERAAIIEARRLASIYCRANKHDSDSEELTVDGRLIHIATENRTWWVEGVEIK